MTELPFFVLNKKGESELVVKQSRFIGFQNASFRSQARPKRSSKYKQPNGSMKSENNFTTLAIFASPTESKRKVSPINFTKNIATMANQSERGGFPILQLLQGQELENSIAIVVRYFGGVKLGPGGLARAYRQCARQSIELSGRLEIVPQRTLDWDISYDLLATLEHWIKDRDSIRITDKTFAEKITIRFEIRADCFTQSTADLAVFLQISLQTLTKQKM